MAETLWHQCPGCWSIVREVIPRGGWLECDCGEKLMVIDLRSPERARSQGLEEAGAKVSVELRRMANSPGLHQPPNEGVTKQWILELAASLSTAPGAVDRPRDAHGATRTRHKHNGP